MSAGEILESDLQDYFHRRIPLLDVRAEDEFRRSTVPWSVNGPLLTTVERMTVGKVYREQGQTEAIATGNLLVSGVTRTSRIEQWIAVVSQKEVGGLFCARGGLRSEIASRWLAEAGVNIPRVRGGYRTVRAFLLGRFQQLLSAAGLLVLAGRTGSGKSLLLRSPGLQGYTLDLERAANHYGSGFGGVCGEQPAQSSFENSLAGELILHGDHRLLLVEDESAKIGRLMLPPALFAKMTAAPRILVEASMEQRVQQIVTDYIDYVLDKGDEGDALQTLEEFLHASVARISRRLGGARTAQCSALLSEAMALHRRGATRDVHSRWIEFLLREYYDPFYDYGIRKTEEQIVFRGSVEEVRDFLAQATERGRL
jgi:tRNA 2-selenouridine synthase